MRFDVVFWGLFETSCEPTLYVCSIYAFCDCMSSGELNIVLLVPNTIPTCVSYLVYDLYMFALSSGVSVQHNANHPCVYVIYTFCVCMLWGKLSSLSVVQDTIPTCVS